MLKTISIAVQGRGSLQKIHTIKRAPALLMSILFSVASLAGSLAWLPGKALAFAGGDGQSAETAWQIGDCIQLASINDDAAYANDYFKLTASFSCTTVMNFQTIDFGNGDPFTGHFDSGLLDQDGVNEQIYDPIGVGVNVVAAPNTGLRIR